MAKSGENGKTTEPVRITELTVEGFKSIDKLSIAIRPLTILAGANSSGKSSAIQPLLMLKQTLEAAYDPGPLLLSGPNVNFTSANQLVCKARAKGNSNAFVFGLSISKGDRCRIQLRKDDSTPMELEGVELTHDSHILRFEVGETKWSDSPFPQLFPKGLFELYEKSNPVVRLERNRFLVDSRVQLPNDEGSFVEFWIGHKPFERVISECIHVPGLRGNPLRNYPVSAVGDRFPGTFEKYVASVISNADKELLGTFGQHLRELGLTWKVEAHRVDDTQVELRVGRLAQPVRGGAHDLVSIADVGFGVSQTLPVVVALLAAKPGQFVYIEQPEIHLHPRAQVAMAGLLARAANRGVQVVIETHSSLLLLGIQRQVASGDLDKSKVLLHWFKRDDQTGLSNVTTRELDEAGRFGDWPEDFDDVSLEAQQAYLDEAEKRLAQK